MDKYYHGGPRGIKKILPPSKTGAKSAANWGAADVCRKDRVYVTTCLTMAMFCAATQSRDLGRVYEVEPKGNVITDPDYSGPDISLECDYAEIIRTIPIKNKVLAKIRRMASDPRLRNG
jgi:hypothetical protein